VVKNLFNHKKARYRGVARNGAQYDTLFALGNLVIAKKALLQSMENSVCDGGIERKNGGESPAEVKNLSG
jgi:transposase, IS5 family